MNHRRAVITSLSLVVAFSIGLLSGLHGTPVVAQGNCDTDSRTCSSQQCEDSDCTWITSCLSVPPLFVGTDITVTVDECTDDIYEISVSLYDSANCEGGSGGPGRLGGGILTRKQDGTWTGTFCPSGVPDQVVVDWIGKPGNNYWTQGPSDIEVCWGGTTCP